jgi:undecaprenyl-diphosphatase
MAVMVGLGQLIAAVFPGASRSGTTILIALLMGLSRPRATEFSFLVGIPTMLAAGGYKIWKALKVPLNEGVAEDWAMVAWGALVSGIVSFMAVKWLLGYVQSHSFRSFGVYRIAVGVLLLLIVFG